MEFGYHNASFIYEDQPSVMDGLRDRAQLVEDAGFTWYTLMDHFWQLAGHGYHDEPFIECYAGLSSLAPITDSMQLSSLVTCVHYRNPAYLAKTMASLDVLSDGRGVLGIGGGWYTDEYNAIGIEYPDGAQRIRELRDAIKLIKTAWRQESPVEYEGRYFDLDGLYCDPKTPDIPILIGGGGEQLTLRVTAEEGDWWNVPNRTPEQYEQKVEVLADHCDRYGRSLDDIELTVTQPMVVREDEDAAHDLYEEYKAETEGGPTSRDEFRGVVGSPATAATLVEEFEDLGVDKFQINPIKNDRKSVELFIDEVASQF